MFIKAQKFLILGMSKSGVAVAKYVVKRLGKCYLFDDSQSEKANNAIRELEGLGAIKIDKENALNIISEIDIVVISPGVPINHEIAVTAKRAGKKIIGELEFGYLQFAPPIVAVTGTNGKTTTVSMIESVLNTANVSNAMVGNIGCPVTEKVDNIEKSTVCITEVSSFQLESVWRFCPHIACVTNIAPDHLERHYSMDNYVFLKKRIFKNQTESEYAVLNFDDQIVRKFADEIKSKPIFVSCMGKVDGAYEENGMLFYKQQAVMKVDELPILGVHNKYNALFTIAVCSLLGVDVETIRAGLVGFKGVKHRLQLVCEKRGVKFFNDSKSTNTASTISALRSIKFPSVLILGGSEKGENYDVLFEEIKRSDVKHVILTGASRIHMLESANKSGYSNISVIKDFNTSIKIAQAFAASGDVVLFSPACASFDIFSSYEERGEAFINIVETLT